MSGNALIGQLCRVPVESLSIPCLVPVESCYVFIMAFSCPVESLSGPCRVPVESLSSPCISEWEGSDNVESLSSTCRILVEYLSSTCRILHQKGTKRYKKVSQGI